MTTVAPDQKQPQLQPQQSQQQQQQTVVIINQPQGPKRRAGLQPQNINEWSTGLFGCFEDCCGCLYAYCCFTYFLATLAGKMGENGFGAICFDRLFVTAMRTKLRTQYGIKGNILGDCCTVTFCQFCASLQMDRELSNQALE